MDSSDLEPWQFERIKDALGVRVFGQIANTLYRRIPDTEVAKAADEAYTAIRGLWITAHYLSCASPNSKPFLPMGANRSSSGPFAAWARWNARHG